MQNRLKSDGDKPELALRRAYDGGLTLQYKVKRKKMRGMLGSSTRLCSRRHSELRAKAKKDASIPNGGVQVQSYCIKHYMSIAYRLPTATAAKVTAANKTGCRLAFVYASELPGLVVDGA